MYGQEVGGHYLDTIRVNTVALGYKLVEELHLLNSPDISLSPSSSTLPSDTCLLLRIVMPLLHLLQRICDLQTNRVRQLHMVQRGLGDGPDEL